MRPWIIAMAIAALVLGVAGVLAWRRAAAVAIPSAPTPGSLLGTAYYQGLHDALRERARRTATAGTLSAGSAALAGLAALLAAW